ncbi:hypothetical protein [Streptomyces humi]|uniref:hypothetical protein n=1 Tax=Streptomyces humi TaxID=1428620 RepID=UPI000628719D|nr:hypothetical protein [Streptomyces humi]
MGARTGRAGRGRGGAPRGDAGRAPYEGPRAVGVVDGRWLVGGRDGRLTAYARADGGLLRWTEERPGGPEWSGPDFFAAPGITDVSAAQGADGYVHLVARREPGGAAPVDIVHAVQYQTGRPVTEWRSMGNPGRTPERAALVGAPVAAVSASGRVHVFVRNAGGGVCLRREAPDGRWEPWRDLRGGGVRAGMTATATGSGRIELFVPGEGSAMHWSQSAPDGEPERRPNLGVAAAEGSPVVLETAPERATFYWTDMATDGIVAHRPGSWVIPLGGGPAAGRIAALRTALDGYDCTVLAVRDRAGEISLAAFGTENEGGGVWWSPTGERSAHGPALARDAHGRVVLAFLDEAGVLRVARQSDEAGLVMGRSVPA